MFEWSMNQRRVKASAGPGDVPNAGTLQTHNQHKNFSLPPIVGPQSCGPGSAPLEPPLMWHWYEWKHVHLYSFVYSSHVSYIVTTL